MSQSEHGAIGYVILLGCVIGFVVVGYFHLRPDPDKETRKTLRTVADVIAHDLDERGDYIHRHDAVRQHTDGWGNPLRVVYGRDYDVAAVEYLAVISNGPDGEPNTADDIRVTRRNVRPQALGQNIARGAARGFIDGLRDSFRGDEDKPDDNK